MLHQSLGPHICLSFFLSLFHFLIVNSGPQGSGPLKDCNTRANSSCNKNSSSNTKAGEALASRHDRVVLSPMLESAPSLAPEPEPAPTSIPETEPVQVSGLESAPDLALAHLLPKSPLWSPVQSYGWCSRHSRSQHQHQPQSSACSSHQPTKPRTHLQQLLMKPSRCHLQNQSLPSSPVRVSFFCFFAAHTLWFLHGAL